MLSVEYRNALSLFLQIHSTKTGIHVYPETFSRIFIAALFLIVNNWKQAWYQGRWNKYHELWYLKIHIPYLNSASPRATRTFLCLLIWQSWVQTFSEKKNTSSVSSLLSQCSILSNIPSPHIATEIVLGEATITKLHYLVSSPHPPLSCFLFLFY